MRQKIINKILHQTQEIYNRIAPDFSDTRTQIWPAIAKFKELAKPGNTVLDLGCGNGRMAEIFLDSQIKYLGIDNSQKLIKIATQKFADKNNFHFQIGDVINYSETRADLVLFVAVLHHIPGYELRLETLKNIYNLLNENGLMVLSTWNLWQPKYWKYLANLPIKFFQYGILSLRDAFVPWQSKIKSPHLRYVHCFTKKELKGLLKGCGFEIIDIYYDRKGKRTNFLNGENLIAIVRKK